LFTSTIYILITCYRLKQVYQEYSSFPEVEAERVVNDNTEENSLTSRLFKRRHIEKKDELQLYFSLPCADEKTEPLKWWKINESQFPKLARIARDYLAIPATSVPAEQSFSISKNLITERRN
jgi:hAT family protein